MAVISGGLTGTVLSNSNIHSSLVIGDEAEFSSTEVTINNFTGLEIDCINKVWSIKVTQYDYQKIDNIPVISLKSHCLEGAKFHSLGFSMSSLFIGDYAFQNCNVWNATALDELFRCFSIGINAFQWMHSIKMKKLL
ncbi:BspA-like protein [Candidatus Malacoplasma girerdii]|uniref:BspA-like protein n=1 Tax=Candidatus Malacoplasma girerdii TaxID=1318617 RepID=A0A097STB0_9BACT|nr:BspA-like protein [Candidatus Malacoplasma girerdii]